MKDYKIIKCDTPGAARFKCHAENYFVEHISDKKSPDEYFKSGKCMFAQEVTSLKIVGVLLYSPQEWESTILGKPVVKIDSFSASMDDHIRKYKVVLLLLRRFLRCAEDDKTGMVTVRIDENEIYHIRALEEAGFYLVETLLTFEHAADYIPESPAESEIILYKDIYLKSLQKIASSSFRYSRFHADPMIPDELADLSRSEWVANACHGRAEAVFVAKKRKNIAGFVICRSGVDSEGNPAGVIDLIAVHPCYKKRGIGLGLVKVVLEYYHKKKRKVVVGTQAKNIPSVNLYIKSGFKLAKSQLTFVKHFD